jgi:hypothetical protein
MKTDVDSCLKEIADFYIKNRTSMKESDLEPILKKHCDNEAEVRKFAAFLSTEPGQLRFKTLLRERKGSPSLLRQQEIDYDLPFAQKLHGEMMKELKEPYAGLLTSGKFPKRDEALKKLGQVTIVEVHDDGDLTVRSAGKLYVVTTDGKTFEQTPSYLKETVSDHKKVRDYWDQHLEKNPLRVGPKDTDAGAFLAWQIEAAGDIIRELGKDISDPAYIQEKVNRIKSNLRSRDWTDRLSEGEQQRLGQVRETIKGLPIPTMLASRLKRLLEAIVYRDSFAVQRHLAQVEEALKTASPSYLKEAVAETECQLISPQYYDMLTWFNVPVPDYSFAIEPEVKERKIDEVLQKLKDGVSRIHESSIFREFLTTMSKFWEYSFGNQILIMLQRPGATRVAGFNTWKDLGRYVKAGERGIAILAPCLPPKALMCPLCGNPFTERELRTHLSEVHRREDISTLVREAREGAVAVPTATYFKVVYVFDVSQTEGKPLPEIAVPVLSGAFSKELYDKLMALASKQGLTVSFEPRPEQNPEIKGILLGKDIWVKGDEPEAQRLKTLAHEEAHYFTEAVYLIPRADAEVIAESVAFVVCTHFGFDTGTRSFPYVALWAKEKKVLEQNLASIRKISGRMIEELG